MLYSMAKRRLKNRAAVLMAKRRWKGIGKQERSRIMTRVVQAREIKRKAAKPLDGDGPDEVF